MIPQNQPSDPRKWPVGASTAAFNGPDQFNDDLLAFAAAGISHIELGISSNWMGTPEGNDEIAKRAKAIKQAGLTLWSAHIPFGTKWDFTSPDEDFRKNILRVFAEAIRYLASLGVGRAVIHPSWEPVANEIRADALKRSREGLHYLAEVGATCGLTIAAEDLPRTCLANTSAEMLALLDGSDYLRVCLDANHLLQETTEEFISKVGSKIVTVHMSDYDFVNERHWMPGKGINNWTAIIAGLAQSGYTGPFLYEVTQKNAGPYTPEDLVNCWKGLLNNYLASI